MCGCHKRKRGAMGAGERAGGRGRGGGGGRRRVVTYRGSANGVGESIVEVGATDQPRRLLRRRGGSRRRDRDGGGGSSSSLDGGGGLSCPAAADLEDPAQLDAMLAARASASRDIVITILGPTSGTRAVHMADDIGEAFVRNLLTTLSSFGVTNTLPITTHLHQPDQPGNNLCLSRLRRMRNAPPTLPLNVRSAR